MSEHPESERRVYNKIVRDGIPEIIQGKGGHAETEIVEPAEAQRLLIEKLAEEATEVSEADPEHLAEELADVLEVVRAIAECAGLDLKSIEELREKKLKERGGFTRRIKLISS